MGQPISDGPGGRDWDEYDWERFLQQSEARAAKYQELVETLLDHPSRDELIAREMGWEDALAKCGGAERNCPCCERRFDCEAYEMLRLTAEPESLEDDPEADELIACFEEVRHIPAYRSAQEFADRLEKWLREHVPGPDENKDAVHVLMAAHTVAAQIAGGHGIGYERDSLCGNIANCKRALGNLSTCLDGLYQLESRGILPPPVAEALRAEAEDVSRELGRWIENLRARVWWR